MLVARPLVLEERIRVLTQIFFGPNKVRFNGLLSDFDTFLSVKPFCEPLFVHKRSTPLGALP